MNPKIFIATGTRAEFGLLKNLMEFIENDHSLELHIGVTGTHLSKKHGFTYKEIKSYRFKNIHKLEMPLENDDPSYLVNSVGILIQKASKIFKKLKPDYVLLLGDRFEIFGLAFASTLFNIPIIHLHGGEITEGAFDDQIRHAITKLSSYHLVANQIYKKRIIQMGEEPKRVFVTGGFGLDNLNKNLQPRKKLLKSINIIPSKKLVLVAYHPETVKGSDNVKNFNILLDVLSKFNKEQIVFSTTNSDPGSQEITKLYKNFIKHNSSFSQELKTKNHYEFISFLNAADVIIGNSSSGLLEAPTLKTPTINLGNRQKGRLLADSVLSPQNNKSNILKVLEDVLYSDLTKSFSYKNPNGVPGAAKKAYSIIKKIVKSQYKTKTFHEIKF